MSEVGLCIGRSAASSTIFVVLSVGFVNVATCHASVVFLSVRVNRQDALSRDNLSFSVDKKNLLDVTFCILYFSSNSCSTCFGQPCAHHQELTTA